jgi:hypothetical protein
VISRSIAARSSSSSRPNEYSTRCVTSWADAHWLWTNCTYRTNRPTCSVATRCAYTERRNCTCLASPLFRRAETVQMVPRRVTRMLAMPQPDQACHLRMCEIAEVGNRRPVAIHARPGGLGPSSADGSAPVSLRACLVTSCCSPIAAAR